MKAKIKIIIPIFLVLISFAPLAHGSLVICGIAEAGPEHTACNSNNLVGQVVGVMDFLIDSAGLLAIGYVLFGGIRMILARGNAAAFQKAKDTMAFAIEGLIIILVAYLIISFAIAFLTGGKTFDQIFNFIPHS